MLNATLSGTQLWEIASAVERRGTRVHLYATLLSAPGTLLMVTTARGSKYLVEVASPLKGIARVARVSGDSKRTRYLGAMPVSRLVARGLAMRRGAKKTSPIVRIDKLDGEVAERLAA